MTHGPDRDEASGRGPGHRGAVGRPGCSWPSPSASRSSPPPGLSVQDEANGEQQEPLSRAGPNKAFAAG